MTKIKKTLMVSFLSAVAGLPTLVSHTYEAGEVTSSAMIQADVGFDSLVVAIKALQRWIAVTEQALQNMDEPIPMGTIGAIKEETAMNELATLKLEIRGQEIIKLSVAKASRVVTFFPRGEVRTTWAEFKYFQFFMERNLEYIARWLEDG